MSTRMGSSFNMFVCVVILVICYISSNSKQHPICQDKKATISSSDTLFSDVSKITHCITGDVIGMRPSAPLISFEMLSHHKGTESSEERIASFSNIFQKRMWGINRRVQFSASGNCFQNRDYLCGYDNLYSP